MRYFENVLIVRTDRIGDVVLTIPMIYLIKKNFPNSKISVLVREYTVDLLFGNDVINEIITVDKIGYIDLLKKIKEKRFSAVFNVSPTFSISFLLFLAGIPLRVGTGYRWYSFLFNKRVFEHRKYAENHETEFNINFLEKVGLDTKGKREFNIPIRETDIEKAAKILSDKGIKINDKIIIIHPGSGKSALDLPADKFLELANLLLRNEEIKLIFTGEREETVLINGIVKKLTKPVTTIISEMNLKEIAYLCKISRMFISNSTGPLHIAAAMGTYVVGFYAPILACSEKRWGPYTEKKMIFKPDISECKKCNKQKCEKFNCMSRISIPEVYSKISAVIN